MATNSSQSGVMAFAPAVVFPPGQFIRETLDALGWTQGDLADVMGRPEAAISEIVTAKKSVTVETARELEAALGIDAELWVRMESMYRLWKTSPASETIAKRRAIRARTPLRFLLSRGWVQPTKDVTELENRVKAFLGVKDLHDRPQLKVAAKQTDYGSELSPAQEAWLLRAKQIAKTIPAVDYSKKKLIRAEASLRDLLGAPEEARHVPRILADAGVRFVVVEKLPGLKIDGVCFWLDRSSPVIALSMRLDRIDNFWFVLRHEIEHVLNRDQPVLDTNLEHDTATVSEQEKRANAAAAEFCVPQTEFDDFMVRVGPLYTHAGIQRFAWRIGGHPGLVAGQLRRRLGLWDRFAKHLEKVRDVVVSTAMVDGFGSTLEIK